MQKRMFLVLLGCLTSCVHQAVEESYNRALEDGLKHNRIVIEFHRVFPSAISSISYFTGQYGDPEWNSKAGLHERYIVTMQAKIDLDPTRTKIIRFHEPRFTLVEVDSVYDGPNGTHQIKYGDQQVKFGAEKWDALLKANMDFSMIGITLEKDRPVSGFSKAMATN